VVCQTGRRSPWAVATLLLAAAPALAAADDPSGRLLAAASRGDAARLAALLRPGGRLLNHGIAKLKDFDTADEGAFSERFVFPDGVPLPLSRISLALERAGFVTTHVEGLASDYAETTGHWIRRFEGRYEDAVRLAGAERARVWRLYLHAAHQGVETGWASVYQVLAHRPAG
jgi:cyclopropane-fatty-acyl-phospholipid synthase